MAQVTEDGDHTDWFAGEINSEVKTLMSSGDVAENLRRLEESASQPPLVKKWSYVGRDL